MEVYCQQYYTGNGRVGEAGYQQVALNNMRMANAEG